MKLFLTPLSHFSRKARAIIELYDLPVEYEDVGNVAEIGNQNFAGNPLMAVPVLTDKNLWLIDSDNISGYLIKNFCKEDELCFFTNDPMDLNTRSILNGLMSNEVKIIMGKRTGINVCEYKYFEKAKLSIIDSLDWLEKNISENIKEKLSYKQIHIACAIDHIRYFETVDLTSYSKLNQIAEAANENPRVHQSNPFLLRPKPIE